MAVLSVAALEAVTAVTVHLAEPERSFCRSRCNATVGRRIVPRPEGMTAAQSELELLGKLGSGDHAVAVAIPNCQPAPCRSQFPLAQAAVPVGVQDFKQASPSVRDLQARAALRRVLLKVQKGNQFAFCELAVAVAIRQGK